MGELHIRNGRGKVRLRKLFSIIIMLDVHWADLGSDIPWALGPDCDGLYSLKATSSVAFSGRCDEPLADGDSAIIREERVQKGTRWTKRTRA